MKQVIRRGFREIIVDEVPDPVVIPHHVVVRAVYSLISSGTETASIHQEGVLRAVADNPSHLRKVWEVMKVVGPLPTLAEVRAKFKEYAELGYSGAGILVDKHSTVSDLEVGDRVAYGGEGTGHAECVLVGRNLAVRVPDAVPFEHACFATLGSIALNAVRTAEVSIGNVVAVMGLGLVGQLISQLVRCQGGVVIGIDLNQRRTDLARQLGADHTLLAGPSTREAVSSITGGRGVDCVIIVAASKSAEPCYQALQICQERGRIVVVGAVELSFPWEGMYLKEIQLRMVRAYGPGCYDAQYEKQGQDYPPSQVRWTANRNMEEFLRLVATARVQVQPLITHEYALEDAPKAYETLMDPSKETLAVILRYPASFPDPVRSHEPSRKVEIEHGKTDRSELRVALVGAGNLARWVHLPNLKRIPHVKLQAVYSTNGARGKNYALRFGASYCCSDYEEILKDPEIDVVLIGSRNQHHAWQALAALRSGKHVFVEKPLALTEEECRELCREVEKSGRTLTVGFNRRFARFYREMKRQLEDRTSPAVLNCRVNSPGISGNYWMADPAIGGAILGEACHLVDLMYWLLGAEPLSVSAFCLPTGKQDPVGENNLVASFRFADGSIGNLTYCTVGSRTSGGERVEAFAPGLGAVSEDFKRLTVQTTLRRTRSRWFAEKGHAALLESFFASIREGTPPAVTARDGARATIACLRMLESARTLSPRPIDLDATLE